MSTISRRDLFKFGGVAAAGAMGVSMLGGCAPQQPVAATEEAAAAAGDGTPAFFVKARAHHRHRRHPRLRRRGHRRRRCRACRRHLGP